MNWGRPLTERVLIPPRPPRQTPAPISPEIAPEPFDPVVDPPFLDLALRLAERQRSSLSSTDREAEPTPSAPGASPGAPLFERCECPEHSAGPARGRGAGGRAP
jgi:hypothetical protein